MLISTRLNAAINEEIGREFQASHVYLGMAAYVDGLALKGLSAFLLKQSAEEREHGLRFVKYLLDVGGTVEVPAIPAPKSSYKSVEEVIQTALDWELDITRHINELMTLAIEDKDYAAQDALRWFVTEQVEEVSHMENLLKVVKAAGERSLIMVEAYLTHNA
jgi:ferritin